MTGFRERVELQATAVVAGDMKLGDYQTTYEDLNTTLGGIDLRVERTYDTTDRGEGDFGLGWPFVETTPLE